MMRRAAVEQRYDQIPLPFGNDPEHELAALRVSGLREAVHAARETLCQDKQRRLWLFGAQGTGGARLIRAIVKLAQTQEQMVYLIDAKQDVHAEQLACWYNQARSAVADSEKKPLLAIVDVQSWAGHPQAEERLFHGINCVNELAGRILLDSRFSVKRTGFALPDLTSRCTALESYALRSAGDDELHRLLCKAADLRGWELSQSVIDYLLSRFARDRESQLRLLSALHEAGASAQRAITVPLVRDILDL